MSPSNKLSALILLALIIGSSLYLYLNQTGFFGFHISQIPYEQIKTQDTRIIFSGDSSQSDFDPYAWGDMGEFIANLSYGFYDELNFPDDIPFTPPLNPLLAPVFLPLMQSVIFNVTPASPARYWKMTSYDEYNGVSWGKSSALTYPLSLVNEASFIYQVNINITHQIEGEMLLPVISPDPLIIDESIIIQGGSPLISQSIQTDQYGSAILNMVFSAPSSSLISYQLTYTPLDLDSMIANSLPPSYTDLQISSVYLQLPNIRSVYLESNPTIASVVEMYESYAESHSVYDTALQVLGYLSANYVFDPFASYPGNLDRVEWFLLNGGGTSLDFATAYTIILRCLNISSRLVYGFLPGEQIGETRVIRGWNVHFWVEVFNPTSTEEDNWIQFDPTPLSGDITDIVGSDPLVGDVEYGLILTVQNQSSWLTARETVFELETFLFNTTGPMENMNITLYDLTENRVIATGLTGLDGIFTCQHSYNSSDRVGPHIIRAFPTSLPLITNYTLITVDGATELTIEVSPIPPENVTRGSESLTVTGFLKDALNNQPIQNQLVRIMLNSIQIGTALTNNMGGFTFSYTPPLTIEVGESSISAYFNGVFQYSFGGQILYTLAPSAESYSSETGLVIVASTRLTTDLNRTAVAPGDWIRIYGYLRFDNGSGYLNQPVNIYWSNSSGTILLSTNLTSIEGFYYYDYQIPFGVYGEAKIFAIFNSTNQYVLGSFTDPPIYIGEEKITMLNCSPSLVHRGEYTTISGLLTNSSGDPLAWRTVNINFYRADTLTLASSTLAVTGGDGFFSINYRIPLNLQPGLYIINCTTGSPAVIASEQIYMSVISSTSISFEAHPLFITPGEVFSITGRISDDQNSGLSVSLPFYFNGVFQYNVTSFNGFFQISNYTLPLGIAASYVNLTIQFPGNSFYNASNYTRQIMVFTNAFIYVNVEPSIASPGQTIQITVNAVDNYGRNIYDRNVTLFLNNTILTSLYLDTANMLVDWVIPEGTPNGPVIIYGVLVANIESNYFADTLTVQVVGMQIASEYIIVALTLIAVVIIISAAYFLIRKRSKLSKRPKDVDLSSQIAKLQQYIRTGNIREGLFFMFNFLEQLILRKYNQRRAAYQTMREFAAQVVNKTDLNSKALYEILSMVEKAKYSKLQLTDSDLTQSIAGFKLLYNQLTGEEFQGG